MPDVAQITFSIPSWAVLAFGLCMVASAALSAYASWLRYRIAVLKRDATEEE